MRFKSQWTFRYAFLAAEYEGKLYFDVFSQETSLQNVNTLEGNIWFSQKFALSVTSSPVWYTSKTYMNIYLILQIEKKANLHILLQVLWLKQIKKPCHKNLNECNAFTRSQVFEQTVFMQLFRLKFCLSGCRCTPFLFPPFR